MTYKEDRAVKYTNQFGESVQISASDEIWLNDEFFAREMAKLPPDAPRAGLAYRVSTKGQVDHDDIPMQKICLLYTSQDVADAMAAVAKMLNIPVIEL